MLYLKQKAVEAFERETATAATLAEQLQQAAVEKATLQLRRKLQDFFGLSASNAENLNIQVAEQDFAVCAIDDLLFRVARGTGELVVTMICPKCGEPGEEPVFKLSDLGALLRGGFSWASNHFCKQSKRRAAN